MVNMESTRAYVFVLQLETLGLQSLVCRALSWCKNLPLFHGFALHFPKYFLCFFLSWMWNYLLTVRFGGICSTVTTRQMLKKFSLVLMKF